jgi:hypothetical protein
VKQTATDVLIEGRCTNQTGVADFISNLEASGFFKRSIEIVSTTTESGPQGELVKFNLKATFVQPETPQPAPPARGARTGG